MELSKLANKKKLTTAEKDYLIQKADELELKYTVKSGCNSCYNDLALMIYAHLNPISEKKTDILPELKPNVDIIFMGNRVNMATITQEITNKMIEVGLKKFFLCD